MYFFLDEKAPKNKEGAAFPLLVTSEYSNHAGAAQLKTRSCRPIPPQSPDTLPAAGYPPPAVQAHTHKPYPPEKTWPQVGEVY